MLHNNTENPSYSSTLFAFKPRQVLLAEHNQRSKMSSRKDDASKISSSLAPKMKEILHQSILGYLHRNGFSKTLKRFQSEAQIEDDTWKASSLHLEDMYCKYLDASNDSDANLKTSKKPGDDGTAKKEDGEISKTNGKNADEETTSKKKKKKGSIDNDSATEDKSKAHDKKLAESCKNCGSISEEFLGTESEIKPKKKKKSKHELESHGQKEEAKSDAAKLSRSEIDDSTKKPKDKKKKSTQQEKLQSSVETNEEKDKLESVTTKSESVTEHKEKKKKKKATTDSAVEVEQVNSARTDNENEVVQLVDTEKEKKSSKKRKRLPSDENENQSTEMKTVEDSKRQKTKDSVEDDKVNESQEQKTSNKQLDGHANGKLETNEVDKSGSQKSVRKQQNSSAEPKTVNAFQRVKIDQVEFAHEKLQDNSYWAKDGAEVGYGAKAEEVLGQVRGRDFRHEKTKKKRGSYRGGQIDLQSHSIKFNYSDEE